MEKNAANQAEKRMSSKWLFKAAVKENMGDRSDIERCRKQRQVRKRKSVEVRADMINQETNNMICTM